MNSDRTFLSLDSCQKLVDYVVWRRRTILEIKIQMLDTRLRELLLVILWFVKTNNHGDSHFLKNRYVVVRCERPIFICHVKRA